MRKVVLYTLTSLDGVAEHPFEFIDDWDEVALANLARVISTQDAVVLGHRSYDDWSAYWPTSGVEPFATFINGVEKHVAATTPLAREWANSTIIGGPLVDFVRDLKETEGGDIGVHASLDVAQQLLTAGLVDEVQLFVAHVVVGRGRRLFEQVPGIRLRLLSSTTTSTGNHLIGYAVEP